MVASRDAQFCVGESPADLPPSHAAVETHAFSAIYQLDQQGMDEPWALDYVTHEGVEERVFQTPGDIVLYEGASMMHGRKDALKGDQFTNIVSRRRCICLLIDFIT